MRLPALFPLGIATISTLGIAASIPPTHPLEPRAPILGGTPDSTREFPMMVALETAQGQHHCGGALLSARFVLTARHCVSGLTPQHIFVRAGTLSRVGSCVLA